MLSEGRMRRASLRHRAFDPWPRAAQPWTTQDADAISPGKRCASLLNPFRTRTQHGRMHMAGRRQLLFLTTRSDDSKPYMIRVALIKGFQNHIGFAIIRASDEE